MLSGQQVRVSVVESSLFRIGWRRGGLLMSAPNGILLATSRKL